MKKNILLIVVFIFLFISKSNSQVLIGILFGDKLNTDKFKMGFVVGDNYSSVSNMKGANFSHNIAFGLDLYLFHQKKISLHSGLFFSAPSGAKGLPFSPTKDSNLDLALENADVKLKLSNFSMPLFAKYKLDKGFSIEAGTTITYLRKAYRQYKDDSGEDLIRYKEEITDDFQRIDLQIGAGVGYALKEGKGMNITFRYVQGLLDIVKNDALKKNSSDAVSSMAFQLHVGIPMGGN